MTEMEEKDKVPEELGEWLKVETIARRDGRPGYEIVIGFKSEVSTEEAQRASVEIQRRGTEVQMLITGGRLISEPSAYGVINLADWPKPC